MAADPAAADELRQAIEGHVLAFEALATHTGTPFSAPLHRLVLACGRQWRPAPASALEQGPTGMCFHNATEAVLQEPSRCVYVEGFAWREHRLLPVHHAWAVDISSGRAHDPTWGDPREGLEYFGIPFVTDVLRRLTVEQGFYGLLEGTTGYDGLAIYGELGAHPETFRHPIFSSAP